MKLVAKPLQVLIFSSANYWLLIQTTKFLILKVFMCLLDIFYTYTSLKSQLSVEAVSVRSILVAGYDLENSAECGYEPWSKPEGLTPWYEPITASLAN